MRPMPRFLLPLLVLLLIATPLLARTILYEGPAKEIANRYGLHRDAVLANDGTTDWSDVERLDFTFNGNRQWSWEPKAGRVTLTRKNGEAVEIPLIPESMMMRDGISPTDGMLQAHRQFINDTYWLLFPFQLVWSNPTVTEQDGQDFTLPTGNGGAGRKVVVQFPDEGGYTPGDRYDLYLSADGIIREWAFFRGGEGEGNPVTWEGYVTLGPLLISTLHRNPANPDFSLTFTDLSVQLVGEDEPRRPEPVR